MKKSERRLRGSLEEHNRKHEKEQERLLKLANERKRFDGRANRQWHVVDIGWLTLRIHRKHPEGFTQDIQVHFEKALSYVEIEGRLEKAFGDI